MSSSPKVIPTRRCGSRGTSDLFPRGAESVPDLEARACVLGHLQRGGSPSVSDRIIAARFAEAAWKTLVSPIEQSGVLGLRHGSILLQDFQVPIDPELTETDHSLYKLQLDVSKP